MKPERVEELRKQYQETIEHASDSALTEMALCIPECLAEIERLKDLLETADLFCYETKKARDEMNEALFKHSDLARRLVDIVTDQCCKHHCSDEGPQEACDDGQCWIYPVITEAREMLGGNDG